MADPALAELVRTFSRSRVLRASRSSRSASGAHNIACRTLVLSAFLDERRPPDKHGVSNSLQASGRIRTPGHRHRVEFRRGVRAISCSAL